MKVNSLHLLTKNTEKDSTSVVLFCMLFLGCSVLLNEAMLMSVLVTSVILMTIKIAVMFSQRILWLHRLRSNWTKNCGALLLAILIAPQSFSLGLLNSMVNLLFSGAVLWLFTANHYRKTWAHQVFICLILLSSVSFIYQQSLLSALLVLAIISVGLLSLHYVYQPALEQNTKPKHFATMLLFCSLTSACLFIVMPALQPFWKLPEQSINPTGISDEMTPGDIANVAKSNRLAFRADFNGDANELTQDLKQTNLPSHADLYWRVLTFEDFDGRTWRQADFRKEKRTRLTNRQVQIMAVENAFAKTSGHKPEQLAYNIIAEPNQQPWLYSLGTSISDERDINTTADSRLLRTKKVSQRIKYEALRLSISNRLKVTEQDRQYNTQKLKRGLVKATELADTLWTTANSHPATYNQLILRYFATQGFVYTLSPPTLTGDHIDDFLFNTRLGFCAHYASAHAVLLRLKGIPARVVTGYHGGEYNPNGNYYNVYDSSAHAWVEFENEGFWQRVDPTAQVSPDRIEFGLEQALQFENENNVDAISVVKQTPWLNEIRQKLLSLDYYWTVWVLDFDQDKRRNLFADLKLSLKNVSWFNIMMFLVTIVVSGFILWGLIWIAKWTWNTFNKGNINKLSIDETQLIKLLYRSLAKAHRKQTPNSDNAIPNILQNSVKIKNTENDWSTMTFFQHQSVLEKRYPKQAGRINHIFVRMNQYCYSLQPTERKKLALKRIKKLISELTNSEYN